MRELIKRAASLVLAAVLLLGAAPGLLVPQAEAAGTFSDVSDLAMAQNIEVLQLMGVVDGMSGSRFDPSGTLTRAQFCKMAVEALGQGDRVNIYKNYTIFPDVKPGHWAAGYINLASRLSADGSEGSGESDGRPTRLISGYSDGTFGPERTVTYGQAITILMRMLDYGDSDVSVVWPDGYIDQAMSIGLSEGVKLSGASPINRGQAVRLFVNLLNCETKGGNKFYNKLGTATQGVILLDANAKNSAGQPVLRTNDGGEYLIAGQPGAGLLAGSQGAVVVDGDIARAFVPTSTGSSRNITISKAETRSITDSAGVQYTVAQTAKIIRGDENLPYENNFTTLRAGTMATIYISAGGRVESIFIGSTTSDDAVIVAKDGSTDGFALLTDRTDYRIVKHSEEVTYRSLRKFDVATYSSSNNTIYISDNRITMYYKDAYPNTAAPSTITVTGIEGELEVMPCAIDSLSRCRIGQPITLLLTENNKVAGVSDDPTARSNAYGFVDEDGKLELFNGLKAADAKDLEKHRGHVVMVSSSNKTSVNVSKVGGGTGGELNVAKKTIGSADAAPDIRLYETVSGSRLRPIDWSDIQADVIKGENVAYTHKNYAGKVDILVLDDVTGEGYKYGRVFVYTDIEDEEGKNVTTTTVIRQYKNGVEVDLAKFTVNRGLSGGEWVGFSAKADDNQMFTSLFKLEPVKNVPAAAWRQNNEAVYINNTLYTVSKNIDNCCYDRDARMWLRNLNAAIASGGTLTIFVDDGNVVRGVEVSR